MTNALWDIIPDTHGRSVEKIGSTTCIEWRKFGDGQTMNPYPLLYKWYIKILDLGDFSSLIQLEKTVHVYPFFAERHLDKGGGTEFFTFSHDETSLQKISDVLSEFNVRFEVYTDDIFPERPPIDGYEKYIRDNSYLMIERKRVVPLSTKSKYEKSIITQQLILRDYQVNALKAMSENKKGVLILPTGVGKTITYLSYLKSKNSSNTNLILVPSKKLVDQTANVGKKMGFHVVMCYSDSIFKPIDDTKNLLIISTYQSSYKVINKSFGTIIFDECHTTVLTNQLGRSDISAFQQMLIEGISEEKFFFTATEKTICLDSKNLEDSSDDDKEIFTMDNEEQYGKVLFRYRLDEAIVDGYLCDYNLDMIVTNNKKNSLVKLLSKKKGKRVFIYCSSVKKAEILSFHLREAFPNAYISALSSDDSKKDQEICLQNFKKNDGLSVLCLCKLFVLGFDERSIDMVVHYDKCSSVIELTQKNGRSLRLYPSGKIRSTIVFMIEEGKPEDLRYYKKVMKKLILEDARLEAHLKKISDGKESNEHRSINLITDITDDTEISTVYDRYVRHLCPVSSREDEFCKLRIYVRKLSLRDKSEYRDRVSTDPTLVHEPDDYFGNFWTNWYDFLGIDSTSFPKTKEEWLRLCKTLGVRSWSHYLELHKIRDDLPLMPNSLYHFTNFDRELGITKLLINRKMR